MNKAADVTARPVIGATGVAHGARGAAEAATDGAAGAVATVDIMGMVMGMVSADAAVRYRSAPWLNKSSSGWCGAGCKHGTAAAAATPVPGCYVGGKTR